MQEYSVNDIIKREQSEENIRDGTGDDYLYENYCLKNYINNKQNSTIGVNCKFNVTKN